MGMSKSGYDLVRREQFPCRGLRFSRTPRAVTTPMLRVLASGEPECNLPETSTAPAPELTHDEAPPNSRRGLVVRPPQPPVSHTRLTRVSRTWRDENGHGASDLYVPTSSGRCGACMDTR
ncbi:hypothetical protein GCM10009646_15250 [Streptomyces aureus]